MFSNRLIFKLKDNIFLNSNHGQILFDRLLIKKLFRQSNLTTQSSLLIGKNEKFPLLKTSDCVRLLTTGSAGANQDTIESRQLKLEEERLRAEIEKTKKEDLVKLAGLPSWLHPYWKLMRLDKPAPIWLSYWPSAWGLLGAASYLNQTMPDFYLLSLFALGALTMRSAGCIINDIWDRKIDSKVERTKDRPLANGSVSLPAALAVLGANLSVSLAILLQLNLTTQLLGACCLFPVAIYPAAKRFTNWPQLVLGATFSWGSLIGWGAVTCNVLSQNANLLAFAPAAFLFAGCVSWVTFYDTIYGFQDIVFDKKLGLKSTSIHLEKRIKRWLLGFSSVTLANLGMFGLLTHQEPIYYIALGLAGAHFLKQIILFNPKSPQSALKTFKSNNTVGALVAFGLLSSILIQ